MYDNFTGDPFIMLDSDSSKFYWVKDKDGNPTTTADKNFPQNYIDYIKANIGRVDVIFVPTHTEVLDALNKNKIGFNMIYPVATLKTEYINRYKKRKRSPEFINTLEARWEKMIASLETFVMNHNKEDDTLMSVIRLEQGEYITNSLIDEMYTFN